MVSQGQGQGSAVPQQLPPTVLSPLSPHPAWDWGCLKGPFGAENFALTACGVNTGSH